MLFYNNTLNLSTAPGAYRFALFDTGDGGSNFTHYDWPTVDAQNNIIVGINKATVPFFYWQNQGVVVMKFGKNLLPTAWGTNVQTCTDNSQGACDGTGWTTGSNTDAYTGATLAANLSGVSNFVTTGTPAINTTTYAPVAGTVSGAPLTGGAAALPVRFSYYPALGYALPRTASTIGAIDGGYMPPVLHFGGNIHIGGNLQ